MECEGNGRGVVIDRQARLKDGRRAAKRPKAEHRSKGSRNMTAHFSRLMRRMHGYLILIRPLCYGLGFG